MASHVPTVEASTGDQASPGPHQPDASQLSEMLESFVLGGGNVNNLTVSGVRLATEAPARAPASAPAPTPAPTTTHSETRKPLSASVPKFNGNVDAFDAWRVDFEHFANHHGFHHILLTNRHIPVARTDRDGRIRDANECLAMGFTQVEIRAALDGWHALSHASASETFRSVVHGKSSPSEAYAAVGNFYRLKGTNVRGSYLTQITTAKLRRNQSPLDLWESMQKAYRMVPDPDKVCVSSLQGYFINALPPDYTM